MNSKVSIVRCTNYNPSLVTEAINRAIDLIGGISNFIKPQSRVLVKPNLLMAKEPECGITAHPEVVRAVVKILKGINCKIFLGDGPSVWGNLIEKIDEVYEKTGMQGIAREEGIELVNFDKRRWRRKFPLTTWLDNCDYLVSIPKFKTHDFTLMTGAIKNLFGLVSGTYKTELHKKYYNVRDFSSILVDIYQEVRPSLTVVDGIVAMEGDGPGTSGKLRQTNLLLVSADCVALDSVLTLIMGIKPFDVATTKEAAKRDLGAADIDSIEIIGEKLEDVIGKPFSLPTPSITKKIPLPILEIAKKFIKYYPCVKHENCTKCGDCVKICPTRAIIMENNRIVFDYSKCIACFCCQEACPASAIKVKKSLLAKVVGL